MLETFNEEGRQGRTLRARVYGLGYSEWQVWVAGLESFGGRNGFLDHCKDAPWGYVGAVSGIHAFRSLLN